MVLNEHLELGKSFFYESATVGNFNRLVTFKNLGFAIDVYYIYVYPPSKTISRIAHRVSDGGHNIYGRETRDLDTELLDSIRVLCERIHFYDKVTIIDNSVDFIETSTEVLPKTVALFKRGEIVYYRDDVPNIIGDLLRFRKDED
ncbi:MAG: hypothetical protein LBL49_09695 [Clostridiales Family XIII bacterium]|jgi:predicted ABC-type ATPase|nr:hypothetical protein [Clostridiales Family XIII bacterium]